VRPGCDDAASPLVKRAPLLVDEVLSPSTAAASSPPAAACLRCANTCSPTRRCAAV